jgi:multiple sugar transport system substrate-binding protein
MKHLRKVALASILALAGLGAAQTEVVWWDFLSGGDGVRMKAMIDEFNNTHPDIRITATTLEWGVPYYTKVQTSAAVGEQPDIMTYHVSRLPLAVPSGLMRPFSQEDLASVGLSTDDYFPSLIEAATFDGELQCVPLDIHAIVLYYNKEILADAGLLGADGMPAGLDGIDNLEAAFEKIKASGKLPVSFGHDGGTIWRIFYTLLNQQGGSLIDDGGVAVDEAGQRALQTMRGWVEQGYAPELIEYPAGVALFTSGEAAFHINGVWEVPTMVDLNAKGELFDWGAMRIPVLFDQPATWADSHCFAIPQGPRGVASQEKVDAVLEVISWMNKNSIRWASAGHIPAYLPVVQSGEYRAMEPNATYAVLGETAVFDPKSAIAGVASPVYDAVDNLLVPALNGQLPLRRAIQMFEQELESQLR